MNFWPLVFLLIFFAFRYTWSHVAGKRKSRTVKADILVPSKGIELVFCILFPVLISFRIVPVYELSADSSSVMVSFALGMVFACAGLALMVWTRYSRGSEWDLMGDVPADKLVTTGAYSATRHPYYVGAILFIFGIYLQLNTWWIALVLPVIAFVARVIVKEDSILRSKFGDEWSSYRKRVGIIPWMRF